MALDTALLFFLNARAGQSALIDWGIVFCATYLAYIVGVVFVGLLALAHYRRQEKLEILFITGISALIARFGVTELIRLFINRPRPYATLPIHNLFTDSAWSFPSGHATFFFALATGVYLFHKKWGIAFFVAALVISLGRVAAGVHYPSDILGGAVVGVGATYGIYKLMQRLVADHSS